MLNVGDQEGGGGRTGIPHLGGGSVEVGVAAKRRYRMAEVERRWVAQAIGGGVSRVQLRAWVVVTGFSRAEVAAVRVARLWQQRGQCVVRGQRGRVAERGPAVRPRLLVWIEMKRNKK
jgi:hypothetical protein